MEHVAPLQGPFDLTDSRRDSVQYLHPRARRFQQLELKGLTRDE